MLLIDQRAAPSLIDDVAAGVVVLDPEGTIQEANAKARTLLGAGKDVVGLRFASFLDAPSVLAFERGVGSQFASGVAPSNSWDARIRILRHDAPPVVARIEAPTRQTGTLGQVVLTLQEADQETFYEQLLGAIVEAHRAVSLNEDHREIFGQLLKNLLELTSSEYGFIGEVLEDSTGRYLKAHAITDISWNEDTRAFYREKAPEGLEFRNLSTLFGAVIRTEKAVRSNDPSRDARGGGLPAGHPPLNAFLGLPIFAGDDFVGMVGIANRPGGYEAAIENRLQPFLVACGAIIAGLRSDNLRRRADAALRESEAKGRAILEGAIDAIITIDERGTIVDVNLATSRIFGYERSELIGVNVTILMPPEYASSHGSWLAQYFKTGEGRIIGSGREVTGRRRDGSVFPMELGVSHVTAGGHHWFTGLIRDITERKRSEAALAQLNRDLQSRVIELDRIREVNEALNRMGAFFQAAESKEELYVILEQFLRELFEGSSGAFYTISKHDLLERALSWGPTSLPEDFRRPECWALRIGRGHVWTGERTEIACRHTDPGSVCSACVCVDTRDGPIGLLTVSDTSVAPDDDRKAQAARTLTLLSAIAGRLGTSLADIELRAKLHEQSTHDPLTKLHNRRFFDEALALSLYRSKRDESAVSLVLVDVDHFKRINDEFGHDVGDDALVALAGILRAHTRPQDVPSRLGGEEFGILLAGCSKEDAVHRAEIIRQAVFQHTLRTGASDIRFTISCGVASFPLDADSAAGCYKRADEALYLAKASGRNRTQPAVGEIITS